MLCPSLGSTQGPLFRSFVYSLLDAPTPDKFHELACSPERLQFTSPSARKFIGKIINNKEKISYAFTSKFFTVGHVSTQRSEGGMAAIKAKGILKGYLAEATPAEAMERISQVARNQDRSALEELKTCRMNDDKLGQRYRKYLKESKILSLSLSIVENTENPSEGKCFINLTQYRQHS